MTRQEKDKARNIPLVWKHFDRNNRYTHTYIETWEEMHKEKGNPEYTCSNCGEKELYLDELFEDYCYFCLGSD